MAFIDTAYVPILTDRIKASGSELVIFHNAYLIGGFIGSFYCLFSKKSSAFNLNVSNILLIAVFLLAITVNSYMAFFAVGILRSVATLISRISSRTLCQEEAKGKYSGRVMSFRMISIDLAGVIFYGLGIYWYRNYSVESMMLFSAGVLVIAFFLTGLGVKRKNGEMSEQSVV